MYPARAGQAGRPSATPDPIGATPLAAIPRCLTNTR